MVVLALILAQDFSFAPPDAAFLASLNVKQVRGAIENLAREAGMAGPLSFQVLDRVERVQIAVAMKGEEPQMSALLEGRFTAADVAELRKASADPNAIRVELLDERRILISDKGLMKKLPRPTAKTLAPAAPAPAPAPPPEPRKPQFAVVHGMPGGPVRVPLD
ncbi:MAG: hypothetical protein SFV18_18490 [Bryobacteraceae bacterium]|nr:hypothetical protein [Bryobacteraceae bacterium]